MIRTADSLGDVTVLIEGLMADFYEPGGVDWRNVFEGLELVLVAYIAPAGAETIYVEFPDGVRQVAPAGPFDAIACARALARVTGKLTSAKS